MKQENKTAAEWFALLPEEIRSQALANLENAREQNRVKSYPSLHSSLNAFSWGDSPEGNDFWLQIYLRAESGEFTKEQQPVSEPRTYTPEQVEEERRKAFVAGWMEYAGSFADEQANEAYETWAKENPIA